MLCAVAARLDAMLRTLREHNGKVSKELHKLLSAHA